MCKSAQSHNVKNATCGNAFFLIKANDAKNQGKEVEVVKKAITESKDITVKTVRTKSTGTVVVKFKNNQELEKAKNNL